MARKKMTEKEKQDWKNLYYHVKNIMGYDENQALSSTMVLRLKGLLTNKFIENNNIESTANYSYETILNTFKYSSLDNLFSISNLFNILLFLFSFKNKSLSFSVVVMCSVVEQFISLSFKYKITFSPYCF